MKLNDKKCKLIFSVILVSAIMTSMLATALTTALPAIMRDLNISASTGQWLTSLYSLSMGIFVLCTAFLIKRFPTKKLYLSALGIFIIGLVIDIFTTSFPLLLVGRILQAGGNGILLALAQVILLTIYPIEKRGSIMGIYGLATGVAPIISPTLAGIIVDYFGWKMIFIVSFLICIVAMIVTIFVFEDILENEKTTFDFLSLALCAIAFMGITLGVGNIGSYAFASLQVLGAIVVGIVGGLLFVKRQLKLEQPFLDVRVFSNHVFSVAVLGSMLMYAIMIAASVLQPIYIQTVCGYSATISGLIAMPGSILMAFASPVIGKLYDKMGVKKLFIAGAIMLIASNVAFSIFTTTTSVILIGGVNIFRNIGIVCTMMPLVTYSVSDLRGSKVSTATSLLTALRTVAGSVGSAVFVAIATIASASTLDIHGINVAFTGLTVVSIIMFILAVLGTKKDEKTML